MRCLIIEDDKSTAEFIVKSLQEQGHSTLHCGDGKDGLFHAIDGEFDVIILDRMLPSMDGVAILKALRAAETCTPVLMLSALGEVDHRVEGLQAGADDYLTKPFACSELLARLDVLSRRNSPQREVTRLQMADLEMDLLSREVKRGDEKITLQSREFRLLEYLLKHQGQVVTRTMLLENVWDYHFDPQTNVIDVHISRLRSKIDKNFTPKLLHTVRGAGYIMKVNY